MARLRRQKVGKMYFNGTIDITDPCYDNDAWCRMTENVVAGEYLCLIWVAKESYKENEITHCPTQRVGSIGIYLDGIIPKQHDMREIGEIGVDAGVAGFFQNKPDFSDKQWCDMCNIMRDGNAWIQDNHDGLCEGFWSASGYGDGVYPVYAFYDDNNQITALEIRFM